MAFDYSKKLTNPVDYPTVPQDEQHARQQFMDLFDEIRDEHNNLVDAVDEHKADIVQTTEVNSSIKYPSAAVTYALQQSINSFADLQLTENLNLNTLTSKRNYKSQVSKVINSLVNKPDIESGECYLMVLPISTNYVFQIFFHNLSIVTGTKIFVRYNKGGSWESWKSISVI